MTLLGAYPTQVISSCVDVWPKLLKCLFLDVESSVENVLRFVEIFPLSEEKITNIAELIRYARMFVAELSAS